MFLFHKWCELPLSTRNKIAAQFGIIKKNSTHVVDNVVKEDGYVIKDIEEALNVDALQKYTNKDTSDMLQLWIALVNKIEGRVTETIEPLPNPVIPPEIAEKLIEPKTPAITSLSKDEAKQFTKEYKQRKNAKTKNK